MWNEILSLPFFGVAAWLVYMTVKKYERPSDIGYCAMMAGAMAVVGLLLCGVLT